MVTRTAALLDGDGPQWWRDHGACLLSADEHPALAEVLDAVGADGVVDAVVIRPDRYVLAAGPTVDVPPPATAALLGGTA